MVLSIHPCPSPIDPHRPPSTQELDLVEDGNNVFKLVGPVLVKQDLLEAQANMQKRLDFIAGELSRVEANLASTNDKRGKKEAEVGFGG